MTNFKALCAELVHIANALDGKNALISNQGQAMDGYSALAAFRDVADRARAALAAEADGPAVQSREPASVVGEPSDMELLATLDKATAAFPPRHPEAGALNAVEYPLALELRKARAVLARYGHQLAPPATQGEVAELVAALRQEADACFQLKSCGYVEWASRLTRAADLLEQRHPAPVPVAAGLPSASHVYFEFIISDADDCTQTGGIAPTYAQALSEGQHYLAQYQQDGPHTLELRRVEVLPPGALPLPQGEVE
jgi:hypothetical protein